MGREFIGAAVDRVDAERNGGVQIVLVVEPVSHPVVVRTGRERGECAFDLAGAGVFGDEQQGTGRAGGDVAACLVEVHVGDEEAVALEADLSDVNGVGLAVGIDGGEDGGADVVVPDVQCFGGKCGMVLRSIPGGGSFSLHARLGCVALGG